MHKAIVVGLWLLAALPMAAWGQTEALENPGSVSAIQERAFRMQHELTLGAGVLPLDAFYKGVYAQVGYTFHFTDFFAWQVGRGAYNYPVSTGLRVQLERDFEVLPTRFDEVQWYVGTDLIWKPFYGKLTVLNKSVLHAEAYLLLGASLFKFTEAFRPAVNLGGGVRLFATQNVSFRVEVTDNIVIPLTTAATFSLINVMTMTVSLAINFGATE